MPPAPMHVQAQAISRRPVIALLGWGLALFLAGEVSAAGTFHALVISQYAQREDLAGWENTCRVIQATLGSGKAVVERNTGPQGAKTFFAGLPETGPVVVYLAAHQSPEGWWEFPDGEKVPLDSLMEGRRPCSGPLWIVMDTCHADAVDHGMVWKKSGRGAVLSASGAGEKTWELRLFSRRPMDFEARFPREMAWLRRELGPQWDGRLSFLGFVWLRVFLESPPIPDTPEGWEWRARRMQDVARSLKPQRQPDFRSSLGWHVLP